MQNLNAPADTSSTPEQREIARSVLQHILELGEPQYAGPSPFTDALTSWTVGVGTLYEAAVLRLKWEPDSIFHFHADGIWRRGMAYEIIKRMDDLDRDMKNAVIRIVWDALPNPSVIAVLLAYAPGERPVSIPDTTPAPRVLSDAALRSRAMIANQFGGFQWSRSENGPKAEPKVR